MCSDANAHGASSSDSLFPIFFIWFSLILHTMRMLSDILTIAPMYLVSRIMRRHFATAHCGFWIQFQCIINMECTVYVWQRSDDTKRYRISAHSLAPCVCGVCIHTKTNLWIHKIFIVIPQCFARDLKSYIWFFCSFYMMLTNNGRLTEDFTRNGGWESIWKSVNNNTCNNVFFPLNKHRVWLKSDWTIFNIAKEMTLATKLQPCFIGQRVHLSDLLWIFLTLSTIYVWCNSKKREKIVYFWLFIDYERKLNFYHLIFQ